MADHEDPGTTDADLDQYRVAINEVDQQLVALFTQRFALTEQIGAVKARLGLPPADPQREAKVYERVRERARELGGSPDLVEEMYRHIMAWVVFRHRQIAKELE